MRRFVCYLMSALVLATPFSGAAADSHDSGAVATAEMPCHDAGSAPAKQSQPDCDSCPGAYHCCAGYLAPAELTTEADLFGFQKIVFGQHFFAGHVSTPLDPPPLAV